MKKIEDPLQNRFGTLSQKTGLIEGGAGENLRNITWILGDPNWRLRKFFPRLCKFFPTDFFDRDAYFIFSRLL